MMRHRFLLIILVVLLSLGFSSCATRVNRVQTGTADELTGDGNEIDVEIVCNALLDDMFSSSRYRQ